MLLVFPSAEVGANTATRTQVGFVGERAARGLLTFPTFTKVHHDTNQPVGSRRVRMLAATLSLGRRDTSPLRITRYRRTLGEVIRSLEPLGTNRLPHR